MNARLQGWLKRHLPTRESLAHNRWIRPFAHRVGLVARACNIGEWLLHLGALTGIQPLGETMQHTRSDHRLKQLTVTGRDTAVLAG